MDSGKEGSFINRKIAALEHELIYHESNSHFLERGYAPLFVAHEGARILVVGQAPGIQAQEKGRVWDDASGQRLIKWLGVDEATFRDPTLFANLPMDFYYPGKGKSGDNPPRKDFAAQWHPKFSEYMPHIKLTILVGRYAQRYYLKKNAKKNLTETVHAYREYLPGMFPIVHPSPLNFRWLAKNPWFEGEVVPVLQERVREITY